MPGSPLNTALPRIAGTPLVGQTLTAENGTWVGTPPIEYAYQWYACTMSGCEAIVGQTEATHTLCSAIPNHRRVHYVQKGVGHYGVFNGSRFKSEIVPRISDFMVSAANVKPSLAYAAE